MLRKFNHRSTKLERLDTGDYTQAEYDLWLKEMRFIHRFAGESRAVRRSLLPGIRDRDRVSILDVGAGTGELVEFIRVVETAKNHFLLGADIGYESVRAMRKRSIDCVQCNGLSLPFGDDKFDYVVSSLTFHHLTDVDAVALLKEMKRVSRERVYVLDLHRSPVAYYCFRVLGRLLFQEFTRQDGSLSILRAFKPTELYEIAGKAGLTEIKLHRSWAYRLVLSGR